MNDCKEQTVTIIIIIIIVICATISTALVTLRDQLGYRKQLELYRERYGDIVGYNPRTE